MNYALCVQNLSFSKIIETILNSVLKKVLSVPKNVGNYWTLKNQVNLISKNATEKKFNAKIALKFTKI